MKCEGVDSDGEKYLRTSASTMNAWRDAALNERGPRLSVNRSKEEEVGDQIDDVF